MKIYSFPPISNPDAKVLILGKMPGKKSLDTGEYYAHGSNQFWKIMYDLLEVDYSGKYDDKIKLLKTHQIALWDVLQACSRESSADSDINAEEPNDFTCFFAEHTNIQALFFNGKSAKEYFNIYLPSNSLKRYVLPSTSPANTWFTYNEKLKLWKDILDYVYQ